MKILYLAHRIPYPPNKGEKIRAFHQIQELAKNHAVHVRAFVDDRADLPHVPAFRNHCASVDVVYRNDALALFRAAVGLLTRRPLSVSLFYRRAFAEMVRQTLASQRFDCIICSSSSMAQYASLAGAVPKVMDFIDVDSEKWRLYARRHAFPLSLVYRLEGERLARYEETIAEAFDHSIVSSAEEQRLLQGRIPGRALTVISNGVDLQYFSRSEVDLSQTSAPSVVFIGVMDYFPNVDAVRYFCREVFPLVLESVPDALFYIVGRNPTPEVMALSNQMNVIVTGTVADVRPYLAGATVSVAPLRIARGMQNKILESMAIGVPVVGTTESFNGIAASERDGIRIADDPCSFAQHVVAFLRSDARLRCQTARRARRFVESHHRWEDQGAQLERLLEEVAGGRARAQTVSVNSGARI